MRARITLLVLVLSPLAVYIGSLSWRSWKRRPLAPGQTIAAMTVPEGFSVEPVAAEPAIVHPVAMTFDERGRIWVVESPTTSADGSRRAPGRIRVLASSAK